MTAKPIYKIPIIGRGAFCFFYIVGLGLLPVLLKLGGYRKLMFGSTVVWTPENRREAITDGFDFLQSIDKSMYNCITSEGRLIFFYTAEKSPNCGGRYYALQEQFVRWKREGVAAALVESILMFRAAPTMNKISLKDGASIRLIAPRVVEWMRDHSFRADFIESYRSATYKWEN